MANKNKIIKAANALATPQASCADEQETAQDAYDSLTTYYPSEQDAAANALADLNSVISSCEILLQHGTTADIKTDANSDISEMWGYFYDANKW